MEVNMDPKYKQMLDDEFDAFTMLSGGSIVSIMHVQGNTTRWSPSGVELFGLSGEYIPNGSMDWGDFVHPEDRKRYMDVMTPLITGERQTYDLTYRVRTKNGEYGNFRAVGAVLRDANGDPSMIGGVLINQGLTENVDPVTVLPNKNAYLGKLAEWINAGKSTFSLQVGISKMSRLNQVHGYTYGNRILQEIAWLIQETVKERGLVYRTDGSTFVFLTDSLSRQEVAAIYDMLSYRMQRGIQINGIRNILTANGGLISTQGSENSAGTVYSCLSYAYEESKERKHGELVDFNGSINYDSSDSLELINTIRDCVLDDCRGFSMEYDPVIAVSTEEKKGAEALIVWQNDRYGRVTAQDFIPILERDFIFEELGDFILKNSLADGVRLLKKDPGFLLCINIYRIQLESNYFIDNLLYCLKETGFPSDQLSLKFTSDCRFIEIGRMREIIQKLHDQKILVIIDGFGSGTDSIVFLKNTPVDAVCLDDRFIDGIEENSRDRDILEHLTKMAATCVEHINVKGVEGREVLDIIKEFPVTTIQGEYFSKPLSCEQMMELY